MVLTYVLEFSSYACPTGYKVVHKIDREWYMNSCNCVADFFMGPNWRTQYDIFFVNVLRITK